ncbi:flagellar motor stator protein MotA [Paludibaculum fermentans]|uniref:Flagellar motor stator protein MotA n=1 Tax=Paludibaculum fermentans TaxID=1473598 RepID=A0A7S7NS52_PALFE|nr:flagellar motor stator protein MotA [Paludibaculum fermentans]QOY88835.1 flagellar motor stator protein MotA [Paludibaculum fermentans]
MLVIAGVLVVIGAIIGGYLMEKGNLLVLMQPAELLIIGGAALGTLLIANPPHIMMAILKGLPGTIKGSKFGKAYFTETLKMLYDLFVYIRKVGPAAAEADVEDPKASSVFSQFPKLLADHHALDFVCDTLRTYSSGTVGHYDIDQMMESDMEVQQHEREVPVASLSTVADSLPGLGIVAAVLGVVITMGALGGPPEEVGHKVAAALVGTFLGILLCYGFVGPLAANMAKINESEAHYYQVLRKGIAAFTKGIAPLIAVESARRAIPAHVRPTYKEMDQACRKSAG